MRWVFNPFSGGLSPVIDAAGGYRHVQSAPSAMWTVIHNLGYKPGGITVEDSAGEEWIAFNVDYVDDDTLTLTFSAAFAGWAYIS